MMIPGSPSSFPFTNAVNSPVVVVKCRFSILEDTAIIMPIWASEQVVRSGYRTEVVGMVEIDTI